MVLHTVYANTGVSWATINGHYLLVRQSNGRLWCTYMRQVAGVQQIAVAYSDDEGATWIEDFITSMAVDQSASGLAVDNDDIIHLSWNGLGYGTFPAKDQILYRQRTAAGWQALEQLTDINEAQGLSQLACDSLNNVHIAWHGEGYLPQVTYESIVYRKKTAGVWGAVELVGQSPSIPPHIYLSNPTIKICPNDYVHVGWSGRGYGLDPGINDVQYRRRTDIGWDAREAVTDDIDGGNTQVDLQVDSSGDVFLTWRRTLTGMSNIRYCKRTAVGWGAVEELTATVALQNYPKVAIDNGGSVYVVWCGLGYGGNPGNYQIVYLKQTAGVWGAITLITDRAFDQRYPTVISSLFPIIGGIRTNLPQSGFGGIFTGQDAGGYNIDYFSNAVWAPVFTCPYCGAGFATEGERDAHIASEHPSVPYSRAYALAREEL